MATLVDLNRKIAKLQKQADAIKNRERKGVIAQIRQAIAQYELTPEDLFSGGSAVSRRGRRAGSVSLLADDVPARSRRGKTVEEGTRKPVPVRYRDDAGNTWTGRGKRPNWLRAYIDNGHSIEEFLVDES